MCGIVGYIGPKDVVPVLIDGLRRLEYRGYDSAGVAVVRNGVMDLRRSAGKLSNLEDVISADPISGTTAWATRDGRRTDGQRRKTPTRTATAPARLSSSTTASSRTTSIEAGAAATGSHFVTETDTEIVAHLVEREMKDDGLENGVRRALLLMRGLFALVLISADDPDKIVAVRNGPPIVVGLGDGEFFVASDIPAILSHTRDVIFLGDEEMAIITRMASNSPTSSVGRYRRRRNGSSGIRSWRKRTATSTSCSRRFSSSQRPPARRFSGVCRPIPGSISRGNRARRRAAQGRRARHDPGLRHVLACRIGRQIHDRADSEASGRSRLRIGYRYRRPVVSPNTLAIVITQSGETADTLAALREAKRQGARSISICNVVGSMVTRETDGTLYTHAGPEIGVASTKAFTSQLAALYLLALQLAQVRGTLTLEPRSRTWTPCFSFRSCSTRP